MDRIDLLYIASFNWYYSDIVKIYLFDIVFVFETTR